MLCDRAMDHQHVRTTDDHHVNCWDLYSLHPTYEAPSSGPLDVLCRVPVDKGHGKAVSPTVPVLDGIDALDLYKSTMSGEIWKNGAVSNCLAPLQVVGWEFYSLLWTQPEGTVPLSLGDDGIELLLGRPPGGRVCPSLLFAFIPNGREPYTKGCARTQSAQTFEMEANNLDSKGRTIANRLLVLLPNGIFKGSAALPDDPHWGLFIGPRSRSLVLLNKQRGAIDLNLATLLTLDAVFWRGQAIVQATARLFDVFGTAKLVPALFGDLDPLKIHSAFTNAVIADHLSVTRDGRQDYLQTFGARLSNFFVSNSSANLCYLTPSDAARHRADAKLATIAKEVRPEPWQLPEMPNWTLNFGAFGDESKRVLEEYRSRNPPHAEAFGMPDGDGSSQSGWLSSLLGLGPTWFDCETVMDGKSGNVIVRPVGAAGRPGSPDSGACAGTRDRSIHGTWTR